MADKIDPRHTDNSIGGKGGLGSADLTQHEHDMEQVRLHLMWQNISRRVKDRVKTIIPGSGEGDAIVFVSSLLGMSTESIPFAKALSPTSRLLSVHPSSADRNEGFAASIEKMAEVYANELNAAQPKGSFVLVGRSAGVVIGLHTAQLLIEKGRKISLFVSLDFAPYNTGADVDRRNLRYNFAVAKNWATQISAQLRNDLSLRTLLELKNQAVSKLFKLKTDGMPDDIPQAAFKPEERAFTEACNIAMRQYVYEPKYRFPVLAFTSTKIPDAQEYNVARKLRRIVDPRDLALHVVLNSTHRDIIYPPHVETVAKIMYKKLDQLAALPDQGHRETPSIPLTLSMKWRPSIFKK